MSTKKLSITLVVLFVAIVLSLATTVVVLVATGQNASSVVNISYESEDVSVELSATAYIGDTASSFRVGGTDTGSKILYLNPESPSGTMSQVEDLEFTDENRVVVFEYKFKNSTNYINAYIDLSLDLTLENVELGYAYSALTPVEDVMNVATSTTYERQILPSHEDESQRITYIYIVASVIDATEDADITGDFKWSLGRLTEEQIAQVSISNVNSGNASLSGDVVSTTYMVGQKIYEPQWTNVTNKRFNGWYLDESLTTPATFPMTLTADTTLYPAYQDANLLETSFYKYNSTTDSYEIGGVVLDTYSSLISSYTTLIIPDVYNGSEGVKPVTKVSNIYASEEESYIYNGIAYGTTITHIYIGNNITTVYDLATYWSMDFCYGGSTILQFVELGRNTTSLSDSFIGCTNLATLRLPSNSIVIDSSYTVSATYNTIYRSGLEDTLVYANNTTITAYNNTEWDFLIKVDSGVTNTSQIANWDSIECCVRYLFATYDFANSSWSSALTSATIPTSMTEVTPHLFGNCNNLTSVTIHDGVTSIGGSAFYGCSGLNSIIIPNSVTSIGGSAFYGCANLQSVSLPNRLINIPSYCFSGCTKLAEVNMPSNITSIGYEAFYNCKAMTNITIPNSVTSIGTDAFYNCTSLTSVEIPEGITSIPDSCFYGCTSLRSISIPNSVTSIGSSAFRNCSSLSITLKDNITSIGSYAFSYTALRSVTIPASVTSIGTGAFRECVKLTSIVVDSGNDIYDSRDNCNAIIEKSTNTLIVGCNKSTIPDSVTTIGGYAFCGMTGLETITIPENVTTINTYAFYNCTGLSEINYDATSCADLTTASNYVFYRAGYSSGGVTLNIGANVTKIPNYMFSPYASASTSYCMNLTAVNWLGSSCTTIGECAFAYNATLTNIKIPASITSINNRAFNSCTALSKIVVDSNNSAYDSRDNCNAIIESSTNTLIVGCNKSIIPDSVTTIGSCAFYGMTGLTEITIPENITSIGNHAFYQCTYLKTINYNAITCANNTSSNNIFTKVGYSVSAGTTVNIGANVTMIPDYMFDPYNSTSTSYYPNITSVNFLGDKCTSIGKYAFAYNYKLTTIIIPSSVRSIGTYAFNYCNALKTVTINCTTGATIANNVFRYSGITSLTFANTSWQKASDSTYTLNLSTVTLSTASQNATWFKSTNGYYNYYWKCL